MSVPAVHVENVTVRYGDVLALEDVDLTPGHGRVCGLVGMNGPGKSTLFRTIMGIVAPPDTGRVSIRGVPPARARASGVVGYVPQHEAVDWAFPLSVRDVVMTGRYGRMGFPRRPRPADHDAVDHALARVELADLADRQIGQLSGGQKKRVFVARGIAQAAGVLLRRLADAGTTVLVSTHDLAALPDLVDEAVLLRRTVLADGSPAEILRPESLAVAFGVDVLDRRGTG